MILLNLPTAYMTFPHCTSWLIMFSGLVFFSRCGVPLAGFGDTGPVAATDAARPAGLGTFGAADEAEANPDAPATSATVIRPAVPHKRQCPGLRIVSLAPVASPPQPCRPLLPPGSAGQTHACLPSQQSDAGGA